MLVAEHSALSYGQSSRESGEHFQSDTAWMKKELGHEGNDRDIWSDLDDLDDLESSASDYSASESSASKSSASKSVSCMNEGLGHEGNDEDIWADLDLSECYSASAAPSASASAAVPSTLSPIVSPGEALPPIDPCVAWRSLVGEGFQCCMVQ